MRQSKQGFSSLAATMTLAAVGAAVGFNQYYSLGTRQNNLEAQKRSSRSMLEREIRSILADRDECVANLISSVQTHNVQEIQVPAQLKRTGQTWLAPGTRYQHWAIESMTLATGESKQFAPANPGEPTPPIEQNAWLKLHFSEMNDADQISIPLKLFFKSESLELSGCTSRLDVKVANSGSCPEGKFIQGILPDGTLQCVETQSENSNMSAQCPPDTYMVGVNGGQIICQAYQPQENGETPEQPQIVGGNAECGTVMRKRYKIEIAKHFNDPNDDTNTIYRTYYSVDTVKENESGAGGPGNPNRWPVNGLLAPDDLKDSDGKVPVFSRAGGTVVTNGGQAGMGGNVMNIPSCASSLDDTNYNPPKTCADAIIYGSDDPNWQLISKEKIGGVKTNYVDYTAENPVRFFYRDSNGTLKSFFGPGKAETFNQCGNPAGCQCLPGSCATDNYFSLRVYAKTITHNTCF